MRTLGVCSLLLALPLAASESNSFLLRNVTVHPVVGPTLDNASVLVVDGVISEIGAKPAMPKAKIKIIEGKGLHVYPGMIDSGTPIGLSEIGSVRETNDTGELGDFNPQLRSLIAVNPESEHIPVVRANGVTSVMVIPGSAGGFGGGGSIISGQAALMHLNGWTWEEMELRRSAAMQLNWPAYGGGGRRGGGDFPGAGGRRPSFAETKRAHEQQVEKLSEFVEQSRRYQHAKSAGDASLKPDLKFEAMLPVLAGKMPLMILAPRERGIKEAVEWSEKQKLRIVLAGVRRPGNMSEVLAKKKIPVILGTTFTTPMEEDDGYDEPYALPGQLQRAGVKIAFATYGTQFARNLAYEAAQAVPYGLPYDEALKSVTINPAEIWGVADQCGSVEKGKLADLIVTDGDPLEIKTQVKMLFIKGEQVDLESKHTRLYKKYMARP